MQISTGLGRQRAYRTNGCPIADGVLGSVSKASEFYYIVTIGITEIKKNFREKRICKKTDRK